MSTLHCSLRYFLYAIAFVLTPQVTHAQEPSADGDLSMRGMIRIVQNTPDEFSKQWDARRAVLEATLNPQGDDEKRQEIQWQWASGLINYPYFHKRETGQHVSTSWAPRINAIKSIHFDDAKSLSSLHYLALIEAWLHDRGLAILKEKEFTTGDNRWLRAKFKLINSKVHNTEVKRFFLHRILAEHIDENGARNTEKELLALEKTGASAEQLKPLKEALAQENAPPKDHVAYTYKQVDGVDLQVHVFRAQENNNLAPAFVWFHGGSLNTGHWSHCPVLCRSLQTQGFVVIQVEYRTSQRFDGTPLNALSDAYSAVDWTIQNVSKLRINSKHIMTGGFSSGATLASQMAVLNHEKIQAGAYMSGCYDPSVDSWYNTVIGDKADTKKLSPLLMLDAKAPPQIIFHAKDDEMCAYQGAVDMKDRLGTFNIRNNLVSFEDGGHFFVFRSPPSREIIKAKMTEFIGQLGWELP